MRSLYETIRRLCEGVLARLRAFWKWLALVLFRLNARSYGDYIDTGSRRWQLVHHPTDFSAKKRKSEIAEQVDAFPGYTGVGISHFATGISRISAKEKQVDPLMDKLRADQKVVVHHIYQVEGREEIAITDRIFLTLRKDDPQTLKRITERYKLRPVGTMGGAHILEVLDEAAVNPLKLANLLAKLNDVESCVPETLLPLAPSNAVAATFPTLEALSAEHDMLNEQWNLIDPAAGINAYEAWRLVGSEKLKNSGVVIAIIDNGFDSTHPAFGKIPADAHERDYVEGDGQANTLVLKHGLSVASIAAANADRMMGVAPGCALLPLRVDLTKEGESALLQGVLLEALTNASENADVVNCSFNNAPERIDRKDLIAPLLKEISKLIGGGGKKPNGKDDHGLVIVFSAGNHDAPISLKRAKNKNGIKFSKDDPEIPANEEVHTLYAEIPGIIVVGAMTSSNRKSGYSNWGDELTVVAPSDNFHELAGTLGFGAKEDYEGRDLRAACGKPELYKDFGGTSAAAPLVTGVVALMRCVNPNLGPKEIIEILKIKADKNFPPVKLDVPGDSNLQGLNLDFDVPGPNGRSLIFGSGRVDAAAAVQEAINRRNAPAGVVAPGAGHP